MDIEFYLPIEEFLNVTLYFDSFNVDNGIELFLTKIKKNNN